MAGVEAAHGLDEAEVGDLVQVVPGDAATVVAPGDLAGDAHVEPDDLFLDGGARLVRGGLRLQEQSSGLGASVGTGPGAVVDTRGDCLAQ